MYRFRSIKYLTTTGFIIGFLVAIGYSSSIFFGWALMSLFGGNSTLQLFDVVFIPFCAIFEGPMMLFAGLIGGSIFDLISNAKLIIIPATIIIRILMFVVIKLLINKYWWSSFYSFFLAVIILMFGYPIYYSFIFNDRAIVINELITDVIQASVAYILAIPIYYFLNRTQIKSNYRFWDDKQFDYLNKIHRMND